MAADPGDVEMVNETRHGTALPHRGPGNDVPLRYLPAGAGSSAGGGVSVRGDADGTVVVTLAGVVGADLADDLRPTLVTIVLRYRPRRLVLDLGDAVEIDAIAAGTLVAGCQIADDCGVEIVIDDPSRAVAGRLRRAGLRPDLLTVV